MLGTVVNTIAILVGGTLGLFFKHGIKEHYAQIIMKAVALTVVLIGLKGALAVEDLMVVIFSMVAGAIVGTFLRIEERLEQLGDQLESKFKGGDGQFSKGFVTASLLFCVGSMAIVGALEGGLLGRHDTLFAKSVIDGITSVIFASTLGIGVIFSAVSVLLYQGAIALGAGLLKDVLTDPVVANMSVVGGLLIFGLGVNMLLEVRIKVGNLLPAVFMPIFFGLVMGLF